MSHAGSTGRPVLSALQGALLLVCVVGCPLACRCAGVGEDASFLTGFACAAVAAAVLLRAFMQLQPPRPFSSIVPRVIGLSLLTVAVAASMSAFIASSSHPTFDSLLERDFGSGSAAQVVSVGRSGTGGDDICRRALPDPAAADNVLSLLGSSRLGFIREEPAFASYADEVYLVAFESASGHHVEYSVDASGYLRDGATGAVYLVGCTPRQLYRSLEGLYGFCSASGAGAVS